MRFIWMVPEGVGAWLLAFLLASLAAAPAAAQEKIPAQDHSPYRVGPGDILQLFVWKEPDLSKDITVRIDGKVTVPLLGDVEAAGETPADLSHDIAERLTRLLNSPQVTVGVSQALSSRFYILGQVLKAGEFPLTRPTSVLQGLAEGGGFKDFAKTDSIVIIRQEGGQQVSIPVNYKKFESGHDLTQNVLLRAGDTILVP